MEFKVGDEIRRDYPGDRFAEGIITDIESDAIFITVTDTNAPNDFRPIGRRMGFGKDYYDGQGYSDLKLKGNNFRIKTKFLEGFQP